MAHILQYPQGNHISFWFFTLDSFNWDFNKKHPKLYRSTSNFDFYWFLEINQINLGLGFWLERNNLGHHWGHHLVWTKISKVNQVYRPKIHGNSERFGICQLVPRWFASLSKHRFINPINPFLLARLLKPVEKVSRNERSNDHEHQQWCDTGIQQGPGKRKCSLPTSCDSNWWSLQASTSIPVIQNRIVVIFVFFVYLGWWGWH